MKLLAKATIAQTTAAICLFALGQSGLLPELTLVELALCHGAIAAIIARLLASPPWWMIIHLCFTPAVVFASLIGIPKWFYGLCFITMLLTYWSSFRTQAPLFLSNRIAIHRLACALPDEHPATVLDVGSGTGRFVKQLAQLRPNWTIKGIESAPGPYLISRWFCREQNHVSLLRQNFWAHDLSPYDIVYAFLSPRPMPELWQKACREMRPGCLLISNSFAIPGVQEEDSLAVDDNRGTCLFFYRIPYRNKTARDFSGN